MKYDDLEIMAFQLLLVMGAFVLGALLGARDRRKLPPPDSRAVRGYMRDY
jgi:hypothetical protein